MSIEEYLVKNGQYDMLAAHLREELEKIGWQASVQSLCAQELSVCEDVNSLVTKRIEEKALGE